MTLPHLDDRYRTTKVLARQEDRLVCAARDELAGRDVVLKTGPPLPILREIDTLLALPVDVGPALLDVIWTPSGQVVLAMERLSGSPLPTADIPWDRLPRTVQAVAQSLAHLHRGGIVHLDLKPSNLFLLEGQADTQVRLLDFGFAWRSFDRTEHASVLGGTPPYIAPEVQRGWAFDHRADQYSLGILLRQLFPAMRDHRDWATILERLTDDLPSRRFPDMIAVRDEIAGRFDLPPRDDRFPRLAGGPLRGRREETARLLERACTASPLARILIVARPGTGLTRFMMDGLVAIARAKGPATRMIDLGDLVSRADSSRVLRFIEGRAHQGEAVLCGVPDPSPGLRWVDRNWACGIKACFPAEADSRIRLRPLDENAIVEMVAHALGSGGATAEDLGKNLYLGGEGNLRASAEGFLNAMVHAGSEQRLCWTIQSDTTSASFPSAPPDPQTDYTRVPEHLRTPLKTLSRAGHALPREAAAEFLKHFCGPEALAALDDYGYLQPAGPASVRIATRRLAEQASGDALPDEDAVLRWLNEHLHPDSAHPEEILAACRRARRIGDREREADLLRHTLLDADEHCRWHHLRHLVAYPDDPPMTWDAGSLRRQIARLARLLMSSPSEELRLVTAIAHAFIDLDRASAIPLLEEVAAAEDPAVAAKALLLLLEQDIHRRDENLYAAHLEALERWEQTAATDIPGGSAWIKAWRAQTLGNLDEAQRLALHALSQLHGRAPQHEHLCRQLLAVLRFSQDPREAITLMHAALEGAANMEHKAQISSNLAMMYDSLGDLDACARTATAGITALAGRGQSPRLTLLRLRRAWAWADLGEAEQALAEARDLLDLHAVRGSPAQVVFLRLLSGYCHLHRGSSAPAITEMAGAWEASAVGCPAGLRADALLYLVEALLDAQAWEPVRAHGDAMAAAAQQAGEPQAALLAARVQALRAQADGRMSEAVVALETHGAAARRESIAVNAARYLYHWGLACLAAAADSDSHAAAAEAAALLDEAERLLPGSAYDYYRGRAMFARAQALALAGDPRSATPLIEATLELARRIGGRGLLAEALQWRAAQELRSLQVGSS